MSDVLQVKVRDERGTREAKRLRRDGRIPAILYGHGEESVSLSIDAGEFHQLLRHNARLIEVQGAVTESALVRDVQWDTFGAEVLHVDLVRVSKTELVEVTVQIELRGEAPGTKEGGIVDHALHELQVVCPAASIPDKFEITINELHLGQSITAGDVGLPDGAKLSTDPDQIVVSCVEPAAEAEEGEVAEVGAEPEVIGGRKEQDEEGEAGG